MHSKTLLPAVVLLTSACAQVPVGGDAAVPETAAVRAAPSPLSPQTALAKTVEPAAENSVSASIPARPAAKRARGIL